MLMKGKQNFSLLKYYNQFQQNAGSEILQNKPNNHRSILLKTIEPQETKKQTKPAFGSISFEMLVHKQDNVQLEWQND